jgi:delta-aminolevulinic acid dehydratase/porphobilinogen synthase
VCHCGIVQGIATITKSAAHMETMPEPGTTSTKLIVRMIDNQKKRAKEAHKITDSACDKLKTTGFDGIGRTSFNRQLCVFDNAS